MADANPFAAYVYDPLPLINQNNQAQAQAAQIRLANQDAAAKQLANALAATNLAGRQYFLGQQTGGIVGAPGDAAPDMTPGTQALTGALGGRGQGDPSGRQDSEIVPGVTMSQWGGRLAPSGFSMPAQESALAALSPDMDKAFSGAFDRRRTALFQLADSATTPQEWDRNVVQAFRQGYLSPDDLRNMYGQFGHRNAVLASLGDAKSAISQRTAAWGHGADIDAESNPVSSPALVGADAAKAEAESFARAQTEPYVETVMGPNGTARQVNTTKAQAAASARGAPAPSAAALADPSRSIGAGAFLDRLSGAESNGDYTARNASGAGGAPTSRAAGAFQMVPSTWTENVRRYAPDVAAGKSDAQIAQMRMDGSDQGRALQRRIAMDNAQANAETLRSDGIPVTSMTLGLANYLGAAGASNVMQASHGTRITPALIGQRAYDANPNLQGKTVGDVMSRAYGQFGVNPVDLAGSGNDMRPVDGGAAVPGVPGMTVLTPQQQKDLDISTARTKAQNDADIHSMTTLQTRLGEESHSARLLNNQLDQLEMHDQTWKPGAFAGVIGKFYKTYDSVAQQFGRPPIERVGDQEAFNKVSTQALGNFVKQNDPSGGAEVTKALSAAIPNQTMSPQGLAAVIRPWKGTNDWTMARAQLGANFQGNPAQFETHVNKDLPVLPFIVNRMDATQKTRFIQQMDRTEEGRRALAAIGPQLADLSRQGLLPGAD